MSSQTVGSWANLEGSAQLVVAELADGGVHFDVVCGLQDRGHQIAVAVSVIVRGRWAVLRSKEKGRGTGRRVEGADVGCRGVMVHDGTADTKTLRTSMDYLKDQGANVVALVGVTGGGLVTSVLEHR